MISGSVNSRAALTNTVTGRADGIPLEDIPQSNAGEDASGLATPGLELVVPHCIAERARTSVVDRGASETAEGMAVRHSLGSCGPRGVCTRLLSDAALAMCCAADGRIFVLQEHRVLIWEQTETPAAARWRHALTLQGLPSDSFRLLRLLPTLRVSQSPLVLIAAIGKTFDQQAQEQVGRETSWN